MDRIARFLADHRRLLAAALAGLAVWAALTVTTSEPATRSVRVAAHDLPSGHVLTPADVRTVALPQAVAIRTRADPVGMLVAGAMRAGEPLTDRRVVDRRSLPEGMVLASVTVDRSSAALVRAGDVVDVVAVAPTAESGPEPVAERAEVVIAQERDGTEVTVLGLSVTPDVAREIAAVAAVSQLAVTPSAG